MPSLNDLIKQWKVSLSGKEFIQLDDLVELEQHLRHSIKTLRNSGLNDEEAFLVASSRLGSAATLETEFSKVNGSFAWRRRVFWMLAGYVSLLVFGKFIGGVGLIAATLALYAGADGTLMASTSLLVSMLGWACLFLWIFSVAKHGENCFLRHLRKISPLGLTAGLIGCLLAGTAISTAARLAAARLADPAVIGEAAIILAIGNIILQIAIPVICLMAMFSQKTGMQPVSR